VIPEIVWLAPFTIITAFVPTTTVRTCMPSLQATGAE
jgi:hypothetical protein